MKEKVVIIELSSVNQQYLSHVRDITGIDPTIASLRLGLHSKLTDI